MKRKSSPFRQVTKMSNAIIAPVAHNPAEMYVRIRIDIKRWRVCVIIFPPVQSSGFFENKIKRKKIKAAAGTSILAYSTQPPGLYVCAFRRVKKKIAELGSISFRSRVNKRIPHLTPLDVGIFSFRRSVRIDSGADDVIARFFLYCNKEEGGEQSAVCVGEMDDL
jgi:hypothetical protein